MLESGLLPSLAFRPLEGDGSPERIGMNSVDQPHKFGVIRFVAGSQLGNIVQVTEPITTIGRDPGNDIVVPDLSIAPHHVRLRWDNGSYHIETVVPNATLCVNQRDVEEATLS